MQEVIAKFNKELSLRFDGQSVAGAGARFGQNMDKRHRCKIACYFDRTQEMSHPSISVIPVNIEDRSGVFDPGSGLEQLKLDVTIRVNEETQGGQMLRILEKEMRIWFRTVNQDLTPSGYEFVVFVGQPTSDFLPEPGGPLIACHVIVPLMYIRPQEVIV